MSGLVKCSYTRLDECSLVGIFIREINLINRYKLEGGRRLIIGVEQFARARSWNK